ncbi:MAG TPA: hypothetical protein VJ783_31860 [Pirellulales bacterium]|nr:hypothetical protein [Pirellulales bacterium]
MIHQIYCTHCTYGTSVLEPREGELADRVLGYSARAASLERNELRDYYRQIERFLSYYLPSDTPGEEKPRLDAESAPRRFFVLPSMGNLQLVGQISYRATDTAGRVGSYFAHVLLTPRDPAASAGSAWSTLDALRLWQAPWTDQDSPELPRKLPALERLDDLWAGARPALDDELVLRFLQTPAGGPLDDPAHVVPPRWQSMPAHERTDLLVNTLQGLLALGLPRRASVLLVTEPSVAALVFYGAARLLPTALLDGVSFSTYEQAAERLPVTLAATTFFAPETSDVRPDLYRRGGLVLNTYTGRMSESGPPPGEYARFIVERLLADGWANVDRLLESFQAAGAKRPEDLEVLAQTHRLVSHVLSAEPLADGSWRGSNVAANYLRQEVRHQLANAEPGWPELQRVAGSPNHLQVLELVAGDSVPADLHGPAQFLLNKLPPEKFPELLASTRIAAPAKLDALQYYVTRFRRLPDGCEKLWAEEMHPTIRPTGDQRPLLERLFARLPEQVLVPLYESVPDAQHKPLLLTLIRVCRAESRSQGALKKLLLRRLAEQNDVQFIETIVEQREALRACILPTEPMLAERLGRLLYELPSYPRQFQKWLAALELWVAYFPDPDMAERRLADWRTIGQTLEKLRDEHKPAATGRVEWLKSKLKPAAPRDLRALAEALSRAMRRRAPDLDELDDAIARSIVTPDQVLKRLQVIARASGFSMPSSIPPVALPADDRSQETRRAAQQTQMQALLRDFEQRALVYADDERGSRRQAALRKLGMEIVHRPDFLPEPFWSRLSRFFEYGDWHEVRGKGKVKKRKGQPSIGVLSSGKAVRHKQQVSKHLIVGASAAVVVLALGLGVEIASRARRNASSQPTTTDRTVAQNTVAQNTLAQNTLAQNPATGQTPVKNPEAPSKATPTNDPNAPGVQIKPEPKTPASPVKNPPPKEQAAHAASDGDDANHSANPADGKMNDGATPATPNKSATTPHKSATTQKSDDDDTPPTPPPAKPDPAAPDAVPAKTETPADKPKPDPKPPAAPDDQSAPSSDDAVAAGKAEADNAKPPAPPTITAEAPAASVPPLIKVKATYEPIYVHQWNPGPKDPSLILLGLDFVNRQLDGPGKVTARNTADRLEVALIRSADAPPLSLATLQATDKGVVFRWSKLAEEDEHPARNCQDFLRRCVVKIESAEPTLYIALSQPSRVGPLSLTAAAGKLDGPTLKLAAFPPLADDELFLGPGRIVLEDNRSLVFGQPPDARPPYLIENLPQEFLIETAQVSWIRESDHAPSWLVTVGLPDDPELVKKKALLDKARQLSSRIGQLTSKVKSPSESAMRKFKPKLRADFNARVAELARLVAFPSAPTLAASPDETAMASYLQQFKRLIEAATLKKGELANQISELSKQVDIQDRQRAGRTPMLRAHASSLSAVVYRRVDDDVQAMYLILGNPQPPELDDASTRGRDDE